MVLHGLFGAGRNWGTIARKLSGRFKVFLVDLPNHGDSPWVNDMNYDSMAADVGELLRTLDIHGQASLLGHSMGGKTAMTLALKDPVAIGRLIVVDIAPVVYRGQANADIIEALAALPLDRLASRGEIDAALAPAIGDPMLRSYLLANLRRDGERFSWRINLAGLRASLPALLSFPDFGESQSCGVPTLVIEGGKSEYIRAEDRPRIRARFPNARFETLSEAGHWVHADAPDAVANLIADFMTV